MTRRHWAGLAALLIGSGAAVGISPATAAGPQGGAKTPPARTAKVPAPGPMDDPLLQQRVSLTLKDATINQAVEELAKAAKVSLVVERPASLALHPLSVVLKDARLRDVMDTLGQLYGYRWRRTNTVFLLTIVPQQGDMDKLGPEMMQSVYEQVLTPEQRAKVDANGYIDGKDLTPGQQGIIAGYFQEMMSQSMSMNLSVGRVTIDKANHSFSITTGDSKP